MYSDDENRQRRGGKREECGCLAVCFNWKLPNSQIGKIVWIFYCNLGEKGSNLVGFCADFKPATYQRWVRAMNTLYGPGVDLKIANTREKKILTVNVYWCRIYYECDVYFPLVCISFFFILCCQHFTIPWLSFDLAPYFSSLILRTRFANVKSHSYKQIKSIKCYFYVIFVSFIHVSSGCRAMQKVMKRKRQKSSSMPDEKRMKLWARAYAKGKLISYIFYWFIPWMFPFPSVSIWNENVSDIDVCQHKNMIKNVLTWTKCKYRYSHCLMKSNFVRTQNDNKSCFCCALVWGQKPQHVFRASLRKSKPRKCDVYIKYWITFFVCFEAFYINSLTGKNFYRNNFVSVICGKLWATWHENAIVWR